MLFCLQFSNLGKDRRQSAFKKFINHSNQQFNEAPKSDSKNFFQNFFVQKEKNVKSKSRGSQANIYESFAYKKT